MTDIFSIILYYMTGQQLPMPVSLAESDSGDGWGGYPPTMNGHLPVLNAYSIVQVPRGHAIYSFIIVS